MATDKCDSINFAELDCGFADEVRAMPGGENIRKCFACGTCAAGCPVTAVYPDYNCRTIIREVVLGMKEKVLSQKELWYCVSCYRCSSRCPQAVNFADIMRVLRFLAVKYGFAEAGAYAGVANVEQTSQTLRRDMIKEMIAGKNGIITEIKAKVKA
jgi:heterodisulfide reductase subunit C